MTELKTLKDFDRKMEQIIAGGIEANKDARNEMIHILNIYQTELRQEAIKWAISIGDLKNPDHAKYCGYEPEMVNWINLKLHDMALEECL